MDKVLGACIVGVLFTAQLYAAACCGGAGPASFIQLARLQKYEAVLGSAVVDALGRYDSEGVLRPENTNRRFSTSLSGAGRINADTEWVVQVPWVHQLNRAAGQEFSSSGLGDVGALVRYWLAESLFASDPYPSLIVNAGLRLPTGRPQRFLGGLLIPATGDGYLSALLGGALQKRLGSWIVDLSTLLSLPVVLDGNRDGERWDTQLALGYSATPRLSLSAGGLHSMRGNRLTGGEIAGGSSGWVIEAFVGFRYFITRFWACSLNLQAAMGGHNLVANQSASLGTSLGFY